MSNTSNPLLEKFTTHHETPPFNKIKTEHFLPAIKQSIKEAEIEIEAIKANSEDPSFENTIEALEFFGTKLDRAEFIFTHISGAHSNDDIRKLEETIDTLLSKHQTKISLDEQLFKRIKDVYDIKEHLGLNQEQSMLLENTYKDFTRDGALLEGDEKKRMKEINERLSTLSTKFSQNNVLSTEEYKKIITDESELAGVPERAKNNYRKAAQEDGIKDGWLIKLSPYPIDIDTHADNRKLREEIHKAYDNISFEGKFKNQDVILETVKLKHERANLLDYATHADFVLDNRMAETTETVMEFLEKSKAAYTPAAKEFLQQLKDYSKKMNGPTDFKPWDVSYYSRKLKEETFDLDMESLRPYFKLENVLDGVKNHAEKLFNIKLEEDTSNKYSTHAEDEKVYEVTDNKTGETLGIFYTDYFARSGAKDAGAWMWYFRDRGIEDGENKCALVTNTCNFPKPTETQPSLLSLSDVRTVFHEFGHALHSLLAKGNYPSLTGTSVKWDFVELPSQLQENWLLEKELLDTFAFNEKGEKLPDETIKKIKDMNTFGAGYTELNYTSACLLDMKWHTTNPDDIKSVEEFEDEIMNDVRLFPREIGAGARSTRFGHLFSGGYSAGYYSYKWAEVLEADIFSEFKKNGLYDQKTAQRLRDTIYSKGGTEEPMELFKQMMGREPNPKALFEREGIAVPQKKTAPKPPNPN